MSRHLHSLPLHLRVAEALAAAIAAYLLLFLLPWDWLLGNEAEVLALLCTSRLPCFCSGLTCLISDGFEEVCRLRLRLVCGFYHDLAW